MGLGVEVVGQYNITKMSNGSYAVSLNNGNIGAFITDEAGVQKIRDKYNSLSPEEKQRIERQRIYRIPLERSPKGDVIEFTSRPQSSQTPANGEKSGNGKGLLAALGAILVTATLLIATRGKGLSKLKLGKTISKAGPEVKTGSNILETIPQNLRTAFTELKGKSGQQFTDAAYEKMVEELNLKGISPSKIGHSGHDGLMTVTGGYSPVDNSIVYSEGFFSKIPKEKQLNMLAHELKHCQQYTNILRTEGITVEDYARAIAESNVRNAAKGGDLRNIMFHCYYQDAVAAGKGEEFLQQAIEHNVKELVPQIEKNFEQVLKMPKIPANSPEGKKALEYLEAQRNYEGLNFLGSGSDVYRNNPLEVEAYAFGDSMEKMFIDFQKV